MKMSLLSFPDLKTKLTMERWYLLSFFELCFMAVVTEGITCPSDWLYNPHHDTCVKAFNTRLDWFQARDSCSLLKSTLLHVDSDDMETFIKEDIRNSRGVFSLSTTFWIASNDIVEEDTRRSVFGRPINYTDWESGQPNDDTQDGGPHTQNCIMEGYNLHMQEDKSCSDSYRYVCEMWPETHWAMFIQTSLENKMFLNYGTAGEAGIFLAASKMACARHCLTEYVSCEFFVYDDQSHKCRLLRLYEEGYSNALIEENLKALVNQGYTAFRLDRFSAVSSEL